MPILTRDQIMSAAKRTLTTFDVPQLGGSVCLLALSGRETAAVYAAVKESGAITEAIVALTLCDETGKRLYTLADVAQLFDKPAGALQGLVQRALEVNRLLAVPAAVALEAPADLVPA